MILQDLIRNYILYREVLKPLLRAWKDSLTTGYYSGTTQNYLSELNLAFNNAKALGDGEELGWDISDEYESKSVNQTSGTRTITTIKSFSATLHDLCYELKDKDVQALLSKTVHIVLSHDQVNDYIDLVGKTYTYSGFLTATTDTLSVTNTQSLTTGHESIEINSNLISETHEKREYLGEFSLTHEETHLLTFKKGGDYHDTDQISVTTII